MQNVQTSESTEVREDSLARGTLAFVGVQAAFLVGGYVVHVYLGRTLGPAQYGVYGVVVAFLVWMEVSLTGGFPYAIRKLGGENPEMVPAIARSAMRGQVFYAAFLTALAMAAAPWVARLLKDPTLTTPIRVASIDIPIYAFYFCYTAVLNARRRFTKQASAMLVYAVSKVFGVLLLVALGFGVMGALVGNILSSAGGLVAAMSVTGRIPKSEPYPISKLTRYAGTTAILCIAFTLLISVDVFAVKALTPDAAEVGYYTAANTLARAPFFVFLGISTATLTALSRAAGERDRTLLRNYIGQALRFHLMLLAPVTAVLSGTAAGTVGLLYSARYASAAPVLAVLVVGFMLVGLLNTLYNLLVATGDTRTPLIGTLLLIAGAVVLNVILIPIYGLVGAAYASTSAAAVGLVIVGVYCYGRYGMLVAPASVIRIVAAAVVVYLVAGAVDARGIALAVIYILLFGLYVAMLLVTREITSADFAKVGSAIGINKQKGVQER